jgi:hypothetical protein
MAHALQRGRPGACTLPGMGEDRTEPNGANGAPDAWIGEEITVRYGLGFDQRTIGKLEAVNERGLLLKVPTRHQGEVELFYPWASVVSIQRGQVPSSRPGAR